MAHQNTLGNSELKKKLQITSGFKGDVNEEGVELDKLALGCKGASSTRHERGGKPGGRRRKKDLRRI